jgi:hypothetical protein
MRFTGTGPWELPVAGLRVRRLTFAMAITIGVHGEGRSGLISLPGPFELSTPAAGTRRLDPERQSCDEMARLFELRDEVITRATATSDSELAVEFSSGHRLQARSDGEFESWEVAVDDNTIVGSPGAVLVWDEELQARARDIDGSELGDLLARLRADRPGA